MILLGWEQLLGKQQKCGVSSIENKCFTDDLGSQVVCSNSLHGSLTASQHWLCSSLMRISSPGHGLLSPIPDLGWSRTVKGVSFYPICRLHGSLLQFHRPWQARDSWVWGNGHDFHGMAGSIRLAFTLDLVLLQVLWGPCGGESRYMLGISRLVRQLMSPNLGNSPC